MSRRVGALGQSSAQDGRGRVHGAGVAWEILEAVMMMMLWIFFCNGQFPFWSLYFFLSATRQITNS